ncbi:MAG: PucR family transcriptional regulator [Bacilli bacterium]
MIDQLKKRYMGDISTCPDTEHEQYAWFEIDSALLGIKKTRLSIEEHDLLCSLFTEVKTPLSIVSTTQKRWYNVLYGEQEPDVDSVQFLYFHCTQPIDCPVAFEEAVHALLPETQTLLWISDRQGSIIVTPHVHTTQLEDIIAAIEQDFYTGISLIVGRQNTERCTIKHRFFEELALFDACKHPTSSLLLSVEALYCNELLTQIPIDVRKKFTSALLGNILHDEEIQKTIVAFFQANLNVSVAAKSLYIHRNSLNYRLDRFQEKTGINIRTFEGATTVQLALLCGNT